MTLVVSVGRQVTAVVKSWTLPVKRMTGLPVTLTQVRTTGGGWFGLGKRLAITVTWLTFQLSPLMPPPNWVWRVNPVTIPAVVPAGSGKATVWVSPLFQ